MPPCQQTDNAIAREHSAGTKRASSIESKDDETLILFSCGLAAEIYLIADGRRVIKRDAARRQKSIVGISCDRQAVHWRELYHLPSLLTVFGSLNGSSENGDGLRLLK